MRQATPGDTVVTYGELVDLVAATLGLRRSRVHAPLPLCMLAAHTRSLASKSSFLSPEALRGVNQHADLDHGDLARDCGYAPVTLESGLRAALGPAGALAPDREMTEPPGAA